MTGSRAAAVAAAPVLPRWLGAVVFTLLLGPLGPFVWWLMPARAKDHGLRELHPKNFFLATWRALDDEADEARAQRRAAGKGTDYAPLIALVVGAVCLTLMEYWGHRPMLDRLLEWWDPADRYTFDPEFGRLVPVRHGPWFRLAEFAWWAGWRVLGYFLVPALVVKVVLRERLRDHGLETRGFLGHAWIYALFFGFVLLCVIVVSFTDEFATYYPFYKQANRSWADLVAWELMYAAQFFSLEFFFRGFWLSACRRAMGSHAIWAMVVPYCMIHFGKPLPECLAAILAGVVLGTLSMKTRSIWSGFLIHVSVAVSMDVAALLQTSALPSVWWPPG